MKKAETFPIIKAFQSPPIVSQSKILLACAFLGVLTSCLSSSSSVAIVVFGILVLLLSVMVPYSFQETDASTVRRRLFQEFINNPSIPKSLQTIPPQIHQEERYWVNSRGMALLSTTLKPKANDPKALVVFLHGYTDNFSFAKRREYQRLVDAGFALTALEVEGHGRSDGLAGLIYDWDLVVKDVIDHMEDVRKNGFDEMTKVFLVGESMGGAIAFCIGEQLDSQRIAGVTFVAPMCGISDEMKPPEWVVNTIEFLLGTPGSNMAYGRLPLLPSPFNLTDLAFHSKEKRALVQSSPLCYTRSPRLSTARELMRATRYISKRLSTFKLPFLILHGTADRITNPKLSQALYDKAMSTDKSIKLYNGMWHTLTSGEPDENVDLVFKDMIDWLNARL